MPFLALNGVTIPTAKGGVVDVTRIGDMRRSFDGTMLREMRGTKRKWAFQTKPITELRALSVIGILQGQGLYLPFDADLYAENGYGYTGAIAQLTSTAADGALVYDHNGLSQTRSGNGAVMGVPAGTPNLMTSAQSYPTATTGFISNNGATLSLDATNKFIGSSSLKVVTPATAFAGTINTPAITASFNTTYTVSAYFKGTGSVTLSIRDLANGVVGATTTHTLSATVWNRVSASVTTAAAGATPTLSVRNFNNGANAYTWYAGGWQIEAAPAPTAWHPGATVRAASNLAYPINPMGPAGMTVNFWQAPPPSTAVDRYMIYAHNEAGIEQVAIYETGNTAMSVRIKNTVADDVMYFSLTYPTAWNMMTLVLRAQPESGESNFYFYQNGVLISSGNTSAIPSTLTKVYVGSGNTPGTESAVRIDDVQLLPFPVDATTVSGWYAASSIGATPFIAASGDVMHDTSVNVIGQVSRVEVVPFQSGGVWQNSGRVVSFTLEEV